MISMVTFYSDEVNRKVQIPIDINIEHDNSRMTMYVHIPFQEYSIVDELTYTEARFTGEQP